jgi:S1-C subfamily serine protease
MLTTISNEIADLVAGAAPSVVQVQGQRRPATGLVYGADHVLTTASAVGRDEHPRVRRADGEVLGAELAGWDPTTRLVLLRVSGLGAPPLVPAQMPRVGQLAVAIARSWSNAVTATTGLVSVIGGPLQVSRRHAIEQVIRTSAPMHEGFAGGAFLGADGGLLGVATAASIRGLGVIIPAGIAWAAASDLQQRGTLKRGYIGIAAQAVSVPQKQRAAAGTETALIVLAVKDGSPAAEAGLLVGDLLLSVDGRNLTSPDDLLDLLVGDRIGRAVSLRVLRGGVPADVNVIVSERGADGG